jgi:hypothetical protein
MICVYNALGDASVDTEGLLDAAARLAWQEAQVRLGDDDLRRALTILDELGVRSPADGKAKLDVRDSATYREAEADYEECLRSCLTL